MLTNRRQGQALGSGGRGGASVALAVALLAAGCATQQARVAPPQSSPPPSAAAAPASAPIAAAPAVPTPAPTVATPARPPAPAPLVGPVTRANLRDYAPWQAVLAQTYTPDAAVVESIKATTSELTVFAIIATWCPDTKRELPRFFALMEAVGLPETALTMVGVDRTKKDAEGLAEKLGITRVPTFVFLKRGQELGRFVEKVPPESTLEREIARILAGPAK